MKKIKLILTIFVMAFISLSVHSQNQPVRKTLDKKVKTINKIEKLSDTEKTRNAKLLATKFTSILKDEIKEKQPNYKEKKKLIEKLEKDEQFGIKLFLILEQNEIKKAEILVKEVIEQKIIISIEENGGNDLAEMIRLCLRGHCWPKKIEIDRPKF